MNESITSYIDDLFKYIETYENNYSAFETEAFFQTYNGIFAVFQALRQQREKAIEVDQVFLAKVKSTPMTSSDLRQITVQVLVSFFEAVADTDGQSNRAYLYCRDLRSAKRDVAFFETSLVPIIAREGSFNGNFKLNQFLLKEIGRYIKNYGSGVKADRTPEQFGALSDHLKLLELSRRRDELGEGLFKDRNSLEFHLHGVGIFEKLCQKSSLFEMYLKDWDYLIEESFFDRLKKSIGILWGKFKGLFSSFGYFRLSLSQRNSAYIYYSLMILLFVFLAIYTPLKWNSYSEEKLLEFEEKVNVTETAIRK